MVLRASVARSASSERKLCTGRPSSVRPVVCLVTAAGERWACATTLVRERLGGLLVGVVEQHRRQALTHVPFEIVGQHAEEDMRAHAIGQPVIDRPDLEIDGLDAAERPLHQGEGFVAAHRGRVVERLGGQAGAHDVDAIDGGLGGDLGGLAGEG